MTFLSRYTGIFLLLTLSLAPLLAGAQYCSPPLKDVDSRYIVNAGIVKDSRTGLTWMRCALGQQWQSPDCVPLYDEFSWVEARMTVAQFNREGGAYSFSDWRLPTLDELLTIVEPRCDSPALDVRVFPRAPITGYWTATPDPDYADGAMLVHFYNGRGYMGNRSQDWAVRLVRAP